MANINRAMGWLKTGKRIKKSNWKKESYWYMEEDFSIMYSDGTKAVVHPNQLLSDGWEIWEEDITIDNILSNIRNVGFKTLTYEKGYTAMQMEITRIKDILMEQHLI